MAGLLVRFYRRKWIGCGCVWYFGLPF